MAFNVDEQKFDDKYGTVSDKSDRLRYRHRDSSVFALAHKYNLNEQDVQDYADYMRTNKLVGATRAFHDIRRMVRLNNMGLSFGEFVKVFSPIKEALYAKLGNIDVLRERYMQAKMEERGMMETARKRIEEAAEVERKRLQEFQDMSDKQLDEAYFKAVDANDESRMRDMVNEAARRKGYGDVSSHYQGVGAWMAPSNPGYESDAERRAALENDSPDLNVTDLAEGYSKQPDDYFINLRVYSHNTPHGRESAAAIRKAMEETRQTGRPATITVYRAVPVSVKEGKLRNGDWVTPSRKYAEMHGNYRFEGEYRIIESEVLANELWWDGNDINEWGYDDGKQYAYRNTRNNRKLNDVVTRDDEGYIIPPSKRFIPQNDDIRYRAVFHGSAAHFDRFDHSFIGTGEGIQAFGWGTYVTEVDGIARSYAEKLVPNEARSLRYELDAVKEHLERAENDLRWAQADMARAENWNVEAEMDFGDWEDEAKRLQEVYGATSHQFQNYMLDTSVRVELERSRHTLVSAKESLENRRERVKKLQENIREKLREIAEYTPPKKNLYTVEIPDDTGSNYLRWIDPLPKSIDKNKLAKDLFAQVTEGKDDESEIEMLDRDIQDTFDEGKTGKDIYKAIALFVGDRGASEFLASRGFAGIEYPSEQTTGGRADGAKNYVIFKESDIKIVDHINFRITNENDSIHRNQAEEHNILSKKMGAITELTSKLNLRVQIVNDLTSIDRSIIPPEQIGPGLKGWYNASDGSIAVVLSTHIDARDIQRTILHEGVAHKGLDNLLGRDRANQLYERIYDSLPVLERKKLQNRYSHKAEAGAEYVARLSETNEQPNILEQIIAIIRDFFRDIIGVPLKVSDSDICALLHRSRVRLTEHSAKSTTRTCSSALTRLMNEIRQTQGKKQLSRQSGKKSLVL